MQNPKKHLKLIFSSAWIQARAIALLMALVSMFFISGCADKDGKEGSSFTAQCNKSYEEVAKCIEEKMTDLNSSEIPKLCHSKFLINYYGSFKLLTEEQLEQKKPILSKDTDFKSAFMEDLDPSSFVDSFSKCKMKTTEKEKAICGYKFMFNILKEPDCKAPKKKSAEKE